MLFLIVIILYIKFCVIPCNESRDLAITNIMGKTAQQRPLQNDIHTIFIHVISHSKYLAYKVLFDFMQWKPRSSYRANQIATLQRPLSSESHQIIIRSKLDKGQPMSKISFNSVHQFVSYIIFAGKTVFGPTVQRPLVSNVHKNFINVISYSNYFVYKFLCDSMQQKPRFDYLRYYGKSRTTVPTVEQFSPKVDRHQFMSGCN